MSNSFYTDEMFSFMEEHQDMTTVDFTKLFNERYNCNKKPSGILEAIREHGKDIKFARSYNRFYTKEMLDFIKENVEGKSNIELAEMFNKKFGTDKTPRNINDLKKHYCIKNSSGFKHTANSGCFKEGHSPWNLYEVGTLIYDSHECNVYIKISNKKNKSTYNRKQLAREMYKLWNGDELKPNETIMFLDGNNLNFAKENMVKVKQSINKSVLNTIRYNGINEELKQSLILTSMIDDEIKNKGEKNE